MRAPSPVALIQAPSLPWREFERRLLADPDKRKRFLQGDAITLVGTTGTGKTHMALTLAEMRQYVLVLVLKRRDELLDALPGRGYYVSRDLQLQYVDGKPMHPHIVYAPTIKGKTVREQNAMQSDKMREALEKVLHEGNWTVVADETLWLDGKLGLREELDAIWFKGRTERISLIACAQRPAHVSRMAFTQAIHVFLWDTPDKDDRKRLGEISGINRKQVEAELEGLRKEAHEALYINTRTREMFKVTAPTR